MNVIIPVLIIVVIIIVIFYVKGRSKQTDLIPIEPDIPLISLEPSTPIEPEPIDLIPLEPIPIPEDSVRFNFSDKVVDLPLGEYSVNSSGDEQPFPFEGDIISVNIPKNRELLVSNAEHLVLTKGFEILEEGQDQTFHPIVSNILSIRVK